MCFHSFKLSQTALFVMTPRTRRGALAKRTRSCTGVFTGSAAARVILQPLSLRAAPPNLCSRWPLPASPSACAESTRGVALQLLPALAMLQAMGPSRRTALLQLSNLV